MNSLTPLFCFISRYLFSTNSILLSENALLPYGPICNVHKQ